MWYRNVIGRYRGMKIKFKKNKNKKKTVDKLIIYETRVRRKRRTNDDVLYKRVRC